MEKHILDDPREMATVLAALRYWQENVVTSNRGIEQSPETIAGTMPEHFDSLEPLDYDEIDELCERLNFA